MYLYRFWKIKCVINFTFKVIGVGNIMKFNKLCMAEQIRFTTQVFLIYIQDLNDLITSQ